MTRRNRPAVGPITLMVALVLAVACSSPPPPSVTEVVAVVRDAVPAGTEDPVWNEAPVHQAELLLQDLVEPRLLDASTPRIAVRAVTDGRRVAFRLDWKDATRNDLPGASRFSDAVAIQLPRETAPDVPDPQMGEKGRAVEISYWRASWQATLDGRPDDINALYPHASVDHYPFEAPSLEPGSDEQLRLERQYAPARALGRAMEGPRERAVQDLLGYGPGTLAPDPEQRSQGTGRRDDEGWSVVIVRPLPEIPAPGRGQIAFAVWDGENEEVGARKMRSGWIPFHVEREG